MTERTRPRPSGKIRRPKPKIRILTQEEMDSNRRVREVEDTIHNQLYPEAEGALGPPGGIMEAEGMVEGGSVRGQKPIQVKKKMFKGIF